MLAYKPKVYVNNNRTLLWDKNIPADCMEALRNGEVFTLLRENGEPFSEVLMDSYNIIRERQFPEGDEEGVVVIPTSSAASDAHEGRSPDDNPPNHEIPL